MLNVIKFTLGIELFFSESVSIMVSNLETKFSKFIWITTKRWKLVIVYYSKNEL